MIVIGTLEAILGLKLTQIFDSFVVNPGVALPTESG